MWCYIKCFAEVHKDETCCIFFVKKISYPISEKYQASVARDKIGQKNGTIFCFPLPFFANYLINLIKAFHYCFSPNSIWSREHCWDQRARLWLSRTLFPPLSPLPVCCSPSTQLCLQLDKCINPSRSEHPEQLQYCFHFRPGKFLQLDSHHHSVSVPYRDLSGKLGHRHWFLGSYFDYFYLTPSA